MIVDEKVFLWDHLDRRIELKSNGYVNYEYLRNELGLTDYEVKKLKKLAQASDVYGAIRLQVLGSYRYWFHRDDLIHMIHLIRRNGWAAICRGDVVY